MNANSDNDPMYDRLKDMDFEDAKPVARIVAGRAAFASNGLLATVGASFRPILPAPLWHFFPSIFNRISHEQQITFKNKSYPLT